MPDLTKTCCVKKTTQKCPFWEMSSFYYHIYVFVCSFTSSFSWSVAGFNFGEDVDVNITIQNNLKKKKINILN